MADKKNGVSRPEIFSDTKTRQKIDLHLRDQSDMISEEDIKNVITDIKSDDTVLPGDNSSTYINDYKSADEEKKAIGETDQLPTSWNIIE